MTQWSPEAESEWSSWLQAREKRLRSMGNIDVEEVMDSLHCHMEEEIRNRGLSKVELEDIRAITARLETAAEDRVPKRRRQSYSLWILGVGLPSLTILLELVFRLCSRFFFDPFPTLIHLLMVVLVPLTTGLTLYCHRKGKRHLHPWLRLLNATAIPIAAYYTLAFGPLLIPGFMAVLFLGFGLLPMAPLFSLVGILRSRRYLPAAADSRRWSLVGLSFSLALLAVLEGPRLATRFALEFADVKKPEVAQSAIRFLRLLGSESTILRACYERPRRFMNPAALLLGRGNQVEQHEAREIFFRVTGRPFNSVAPPRLFHSNGRWEDLDDLTWDFDPALGGMAVAGRVRGLSMTESRIDGHLHARAGVAYLEWTMEFLNESFRQREARAQIRLPAGGVVSRLTLWVDGEEREAAFASQQDTRQAYQQVAVIRRRDPVLVTTSGPDQVLMQCFPVPPRGGVMKVRIGITAPLSMMDAGKGWLALPLMIERNFNLQDDLKHHLWVDSPNALLTASPDTGSKDGNSWRAALNDTRLTLHASLSEPAGPVWTTGSDPGQAIVQDLVPGQPMNCDRLVVVADGSLSMRDHMEAVARALDKVPESLELLVIHASDAGEGRALDRSEAMARTGRWKAVGGQDNLPALVRAWDLASEGKQGAVLWIHGPQPVLLGKITALRQRLQRSKGNTRFFDIQTEPGPNRIREELRDCRMEIVSRYGVLEEDLGAWLAALEAQNRLRRFVRRAVPAETIDQSLPQVTDHVRRLWALDWIRELIDRGDRDMALEISAREQLVTPVSGAVVLENQEQYESVGLSPVDPTTVPVIPEPATWLLLVLGLCLVPFLRRRSAF